MVPCRRMEEEDKKRDLEILKNYQKKETIKYKKNIYNNFFNICIGLHSEITYGVFLTRKEKYYVKKN